MAKQGLLNDLQMPKSRRQILLALKENGGLTADELARRLEISAVAVRRHLDNLSNGGLVDYEEVQRGMGRPSFVYSLTDKANEIFPRGYQELAYDMLDTIRDTYGLEAVDRIFVERNKKIINVYRPHVTAPTLAGRLEQLADLRTRDGFMATWKRLGDGTYLFTELNCPIQDVAETCGQACISDMTLFVELLNAKVTRQSHRVQGDHTCSYLVTPRE